MSREQQESGGQTLVIFALGLLLVFLVLAAQYESFVLPFVGRPLGAAGGARRSHADAWVTHPGGASRSVAEIRLD